MERERERQRETERERGFKPAFKINYLVRVLFFSANYLPDIKMPKLFMDFST